VKALGGYLKSSVNANENLGYRNDSVSIKAETNCSVGELYIRQTS